MLAFIVALDFRLAADQSFSTFILDPGGFPVGRDFLNTWMGGRSVFSSGPADWFDSDVYMVALRSVTGISDLAPMYWSYPPHLVFLIWPFGLLGYLPSYIVWCAGGLALSVWAAVASGVDRKYWVILAVAPAVTVNVSWAKMDFNGCASDRWAGKSRSATDHRRNLVRYPDYQAAIRAAASGIVGVGWTLARHYLSGRYNGVACRRDCNMVWAGYLDTVLAEGNTATA